VYQSGFGIADINEEDDYDDDYHQKRFSVIPIVIIIPRASETLMEHMFFPEKTEVFGSFTSQGGQSNSAISSHRLGSKKIYLQPMGKNGNLYHDSYND
jgi:hypothetical protein